MPLTKLTAQRLAALSLTLLAAANVLLVSCTSLDSAVQAPPTIEGASFVGNSVCSDCHTNIVQHFAASPHARLHGPGPKMPGGSGCESCHGPGSKHVAAGGGRGQFIINPGREPAACFKCHLEIQAQFHWPQHHPVLEGKMSCVQCHDPHGSDIMKPAGGLAMARLNQQCAQCHREQARPVIFEHEALREGCITCHEPHGSINEKMLVQRDYNLCLRCHAQVQGPGVGSGRIYIGKSDHTDKLPLGGCWSAGCHTAVHGSNINPHMLY